MVAEQEVQTPAAAKKNPELHDEATVADEQTEAPVAQATQDETVTELVVVVTVVNP